MISFALAAAFALFLKFFGSFLPILVKMQPTRFLVPAFALLTIPVGIAIYEIIEKTRLPSKLLATLCVILIVIGAYYMGKPKRLPHSSFPNPLFDFIMRCTDPSDRLLVQSRDGYQWGDYEAKIMPMVLGREVIGCNFPEIYDPAQFLRNVLWGKELEEWSPSALRSSLESWGVTWAFTRTEAARTLFVKAIGSLGVPIGKYHAFRVPGLTTIFHQGEGKLVASINRIELTKLKSKDGLVVLRYRYHPAWETDMGIPVYQYRVPEDPTGFIALKNPPSELTLHFKPWKMLRAPWPNHPSNDHTSNN